MDEKRFRNLAGAGALALALAFFGPPPASAQGAPITVTVNGSEISLSPEPIEQAGRVFVPLRGVFESLGASVVYSSGTINATGNGHTVSLQIGSTQANVDGQAQTLTDAPFIVGESTYVPLRFVSEALGATVNWDGTNDQVDIEMAGAQVQSAPAPVPATYDYSDYDYASYAPPPIPVYQQPYVPFPNYVWQPGYWAWGAYGYFWVPGTWVAAPQPGYYWTPGYWGWNAGRYAWNQGYWATSVGYYGGVNYGYGYYGNGYNGGRWSNNSFTYNTYVTRVNTTIVRNVYIDKTVYVTSQSRPRPSYNGPGGVVAHPTTQQLAVARGTHIAPTRIQLQHVQIAAQDRSLLAKVNHNTPPVLAVAQPLSTVHRPATFVPVKSSDRVAVPAKPPAYHAPTQPVPAYRPPVVHTTQPVYRPPAVYTQPPAYRPPVVHTAQPVYRPPVVHTAQPMYHPPVVHTAQPVYHPQVVPEHPPQQQMNHPKPPPTFHPQPPPQNHPQPPPPQVHPPVHPTPHDHPTEEPK